MPYLAKIHVLKKQLCLDDDTYRALLKAQTGFESAKQLNKAQCLKVISYMVAVLNNQYALTGKTVKDLQAEITKRLQEQGNHRAYAQEIATRMHKKALFKCTGPELLQVIDALDKAA